VRADLTVITDHTAVNNAVIGNHGTLANDAVADNAVIANRGTRENHAAADN
jgi:hypothetical protein